MGESDGLKVNEIKEKMNEEPGNISEDLTDIKKLLSFMCHLIIKIDKREEEFKQKLTEVSDELSVKGWEASKDKSLNILEARVET